MPSVIHIRDGAGLMGEPARFHRSHAVYIQVAEGKVARGRDLDDTGHLDFDEDDRLLGVESLCVGDGIELSDQN